MCNSQQTLPTVFEKFEGTVTCEAQWKRKWKKLAWSHGQVSQAEHDETKYALIRALRHSWYPSYVTYEIVNSTYKKLLSIKVTDGDHGTITAYEQLRRVAFEKADIASMTLQDQVTSAQRMSVNQLPLDKIQSGRDRPVIVKQLPLDKIQSGRN